MLKKSLRPQCVALCAVSFWVSGCTGRAEPADNVRLDIPALSALDGGAADAAMHAAGDAAADGDDAGTTCDDGNACNGVETRDALGLCQLGQPPTAAQLPVADTTCNGVDDDCDGHVDEDFVAQCTAQGVSSCQAGAIVSSSCDDGSVCTNDACVAGACTHDAVQCDDGNACSLDSCVPGFGCISWSTAVDDGNPCTIDACDPSTGVSRLNAAVGTACGADSYCDSHAQCLTFAQCASNLNVATGQNLVLTGPCEINALTLSGGSLTVNGAFKTPSVSMQNGGTLIVQGDLIADAVTLQNGTITVAGDIVGRVNQSGGSFTNTGTLDAQTSGFALSAGTFTNTGTLKLATFDASNVHGGTFVNRGTLEIASNALNVATGVTLNESGLLGAQDSIRSLSVDGTLTHDAGLAAGLAFTVTGDAAVNATGVINLNGRGLAGGGTSSRASQQQALGYVFDGVHWTVAAVGGSDTAGSHGGVGGAINGASTVSYDSLSAPGLLGSGGGGQTGAYVGGSGGGRLDLIVLGKLTLDGTIQASGNDSSYRFYSAGGAGGSLRLRVGTFAGSSTGRIAANGGNIGAGAGGGRIAIEYDSTTFAGTMQATGGAQDWNNNPALGGAGTIYSKDRSKPLGELIVDNAGMPANVTNVDVNEAMLGKVSVRGQSRVYASGQLSQQWTVSAATLTLSNGGAGAFTIASGTLNVSGAWSPASVALSGSGVINSAGTLTLGSNTLAMTGGTLINTGTLSMPVFDATSVQGGAFVNRGELDIASNVLTVPAGVSLSESGKLGASDSIGQLTVLGTLLHDTTLSAGLAFTVTGDATVSATGKIDVSRRGLLGYTGPDGNGLGQGYVWDGSEWVVSFVGGNRTGGSHGGMASGEAGQVPGALNDAADAPVLLGSGGGGTDVTNGYFGANGGGRVDLVVNGTLTVDGRLAANGGDAPAHCGGGAGGSLRLQVGQLAGAGSLQANGGDGAGAGGGGRIAISYGSSSFTGSISVSALGSATAGSIVQNAM